MKLKTLLVLLVLVFALVSCQEKEKVYQLGFIGTLSGEYAEVGLAQMYGAQFAVDEINEAGGIDGHKVELIIRDDQANSARAVAMQNELYDLGIDIVIGHSLSKVALEAVSNANEIGMLLLSPSIGTDELANIDDNFIRIVATVDNESRFITSKILENDPTSSEKVLMLYNTDNIVLTKYHRDAFIDEMNDNEYTVFGFESGNNTHLSQIETMISSGEYNTVFIASSNLDAAGIVNHIVINQLEIDLHLTSWASTGLLENIDLSRPENIYGYINFDDTHDSEAYLAFKTAYKTVFDKEVNMLSVNGYDAVYILKEAVENIESYNYELVKNEILRISMFSGINSDFIINEYGDCLRNHIQLEILDGAFGKREE